jgi:hypothetical protein
MAMRPDDREALRMAAAQRRRQGCLGCCSVRAWAMLLAIFAAVGIFMMGVVLVFTPWAYTLGGHAHLLPFWGGWGRFNSKAAGGEYGIYIWFEPSSGGSFSGNHYMDGRAWICTPKGETLYMKPGMNLSRNSYSFDTLGKPVHVYMDQWTVSAEFSGDRRPYLDFHGRWADRALVLDDHMTISEAFAPDGSVYKGKGARPKGGEDLVFTLNEGSYSQFKAACATMKKH